MKVTSAMEIVFILVKLVVFGWVLEHVVSAVLIVLINDVYTFSLIPVILYATQYAIFKAYY